MKSEISFMRFIVAAVTLITLILTPWVNSDSLIIPKIIILFFIGMFFLPQVLLNFRHYLSNMWLKIIFFLALLFLIQMIIAIVLSSAPFEQQLYGRTGRGLGFITFFSLIVILLATALFISINQIRLVLFGAIFSTILTSIYAICQNFGLDIFEWNTRTNGIIGTLGNPNFQSSFLAMALIPACVVFTNSSFKVVNTLSLVTFLLFTLYLCESTQGYIAGLASFSTFTLIYLWYRKKLYFLSFSFLVLISSVFTILGMINKGPLKVLLYKPSVQSRGEMWRTSLNTISDNPLLGVGLDSFGDVSLKYRDAKTLNGINEFTDNAHNLVLQFAVTGGITLALIYILIVLFTLYSFYLIQKTIGHFDKKISAIFAAWLSFQLQSIISPANISMLMWNFIITGFVIGFAFKNKNDSDPFTIKAKSHLDFTRPFGLFLLILALIVMYPWYNSDKVTWAANKAGSATALMQSAVMYPESSVRYTRISLALYESKLFNEALIVARQAVKFNPNSVQGWFLIMAIDSAPIEERRKAKLEVIRLDPLNEDVSKFKL